MVELRTDLFLRLILLAMLVINPVFADDNSSVQVDVSTTQTTPGQMINIELNIYYDDGIEVIFNTVRQPWGKIKLLEFSQSLPQWQQGQWLETYTFTVAAPVAGEYSFPEFTVNFYRDADHWIVTTEALALIVTSSFGNGELRLQDFEPLPLPQPPFSTIGFILAGVALLILLAVWRFRKSTGALSKSEFTTVEELIIQTEQSGYMDWESLRQWLIRASGSDPLGKITATEPLLHRYQQLRFDTPADPHAFIQLCRQCQGRWQ